MGDAIANGPAALSIHVVLGLSLVLVAGALVMAAVRSGRRAIIATSIVAVIAMGIAAYAGSMFVRAGSNSASMTMAMAAGVGLLSYGAGLFMVGGSL